MTEFIVEDAPRSLLATGPLTLTNVRFGSANVDDASTGIRNYSNVTVSIVPEPGVIGLILLACAVTASERKRRVDCAPIGHGGHAAHPLNAPSSPIRHMADGCGSPSR